MSNALRIMLLLACVPVVWVTQNDPKKMSIEQQQAIDGWEKAYLQRPCKMDVRSPCPSQRAFFLCRRKDSGRCFMPIAPFPIADSDFHKKLIIADKK